MKALVKESLMLLGGTVAELSAEKLYVTAPAGSRAQSLLEDETEKLLSFTPESSTPGEMLIVPGCRFLDILKDELKSNSARHGYLSNRMVAGRNHLKNIYTIFVGKLVKFSMKSSWWPVIKALFKITIVGEELTEKLLIIEIPFKGIPRQSNDFSSADSCVRWTARPPLKLYQYKDMIEQGMDLAQKFATDWAEDCRSESLEGLYKTLERLKGYYQQIGDESSRFNKNENSALRAEEEYQRRKLEEIQQAKIRATIQLKAVQTVSFPVRLLTWQLNNKDAIREVHAVFNCFDGKIIEPVRCEICFNQTESFGIAGSGHIICRDCYSQCFVCNYESFAPEAFRQASCRTCGHQVCEKHAVVCEVCNERTCESHALRCEKGCRICSGCAVQCQECGPEKLWCIEHCFTNRKGEVSCQLHAVFCIGCQEPYPSMQITTCCTCGQTVCPGCQDVCRVCNRSFCLNHITQGRCNECRVQIEENSNHQTQLF